ncbi:MAG TPA: IclR family transcriptional regulator [Marmoricola sp.]|nr:IclR family transcriptional regulator [Marmoricola sp.]
MKAHPVVNDVDLRHRSSVPGTQAIDRASALVSLVVRADEPLSFSELSDAAGLARSTTSRLLAALEQNELLQRDSSGAYVAGALFALHAARHDPWQETARIATPYLERLRDVTGETAHLGVPNGNTVRHVAQVDSLYLLATRDWTDTDVPAHCSALGKVLLAHGRLTVPDGDLETRTEQTVADRGSLEQELARIRRQDWALAVDELEVGLTAVAAPVTGRDGEVVAALGVSGPTARLAGQVDAMGRLLVEQAGSLSTLLLRRTIKEGVA